MARLLHVPEAGAACQGLEGARTFSAEDQPERLAELIAGFVREPPGAAIPRRQNLLDTARQRRTLLRVGAHEDPRVAQAPDWLVIRDTVEAVLEPAKPLTLLEIAEAVAPQLLLQTRLEVPLIGVIAFVLRSNPHRFAEVAPGTWVRRSSRGGEGPEAGVPSKPPRPLLAGGAAAAAVPLRRRSRPRSCIAWMLWPARVRTSPWRRSWCGSDSFLARQHLEYLLWEVCRALHGSS